MLRILLDDLRVHGFEADLVAQDGPLRIAMAKGVAEVWRETYGREYHGHYLPPRGSRIELHALARMSGVRTQFMYHDEQSERAVLVQIRTVLEWVRENCH